MSITQTFLPPPPFTSRSALPSAALIPSRPGPASSRSAPGPPFRRSRPLPPVRRSLPASPLTRSPPPLPTRRSGPFEPTIRLPALVPTRRNPSAQADAMASAPTQITAIATPLARIETSSVSLGGGSPQETDRLAGFRCRRRGGLCRCRNRARRPMSLKAPEDQQDQ